MSLLFDSVILLLRICPNKVLKLCMLTLFKMKKLQKQARQ